ncbi:MAG TPA: PPK2 family polyphosphate kinase [Bacteroidia bacterium]
MKSFSKNQKISFSGGKDFKLKNYKTNETFEFGNEDTLKAELATYREKISSLQEKLYAQDKYSVLIVLQAIDAAGKDSCIKHVLTGVNPQGVSVSNFKAPSQVELDHDFIWRTYHQLPEKGKIGVFNRSYYEELLVCKVHPEYIVNQRIPGIDSVDDINTKFWNNRYRIINEMERHLVKNGTIIIKIFLNLGKKEQKKRFLERITDKSKQWKFNYADLKERAHWNDYQEAYKDMIMNTSSKYAPWHIIPADDQWVSRALVGRLLLEHLENLNLSYPALNESDLKLLEQARKELMNEKD